MQGSRPAESVKVHKMMRLAIRRSLKLDMLDINRVAYILKMYKRKHDAGETKFGSESCLLRACGVGGSRKEPEPTRSSN